MSDAPQLHRSAAPSPPAIACAVLTISDTRTLETDTSGAAAVELLEAAGFRIAARAIVRDEPSQIRPILDGWCADRAVQCAISTGGTGLARRDTTIEVARDLLTTVIDGFGELFRMVSYEQIGSAAMLSRAVGGLVCRPEEDGGDTFLFALPGSTNAVRTALEFLIIPELPHLVGMR